MQPSSLRDILRPVQTQMLARLTEARTTFAHRGIRGDVAEVAFRSFLRDYLPRRLGIGHGEVIDRNKTRSNQTDVVIASEDHPFTYNENDPGLFFVDGVVGAGEVKSVLTSTALDQAIDSSTKFKTLRMHHAPGSMMSGVPSDHRRWYVCPPWFLLAFESQVTLPTILSTLKAKARHDGDTAMVDAVFCLDRGWAINFGDGTESLGFRKPDGTMQPGWVFRECDDALPELLLWLSAVMPRVLRFRSIVPEYLL